MNKSFLLVPALAVGAAALLLAPARDSYGFSKISGSLDAGTQRDFRVFNNFADASANNSTIVEPSFPGWQGAFVSLWKGATEWASGPHGDGTGDPGQMRLGDGEANFDFFFAGEAIGPGGINANVVSAIPSCGGGGTLAYVLGGIANGWTMKFCDEWDWDDNPGNPNGSRVDIQGIACHEFGHSLGLGHSVIGGSTMVGTASGNGLPDRSIAPDDQAGVQCIYGPKNANKAEITGLDIDVLAGTVTIDGLNFSTTGNEVWFTRTPGAGLIQVRVTGVSSTDGGTKITVSIPADASSGDIAVKNANSGHASLSNSWPADLVNGGSSDPLAITGISPGTVESLIPGTAQTVTLSGTGFDASTIPSINLVPLPSASYTIVDSETLTLDMPQVSILGMRTVGLQKGTEFTFSLINVVAPSGPTLQGGTGDPGNPVSSSVDVLVAGPIGELEYVVWSLSNQPSVFMPFAQLEVGNSFTDFNLLNTYVIPAQGWTSETIPLAPSSITIYLQALTLDQGLPVADSNVSSFTVTP